jgi:hypothetical protein
MRADTECMLDIKLEELKNLHVRRKEATLSIDGMMETLAHRKYLLTLPYEVKIETLQREIEDLVRNDPEPGPYKTSCGKIGYTKEHLRRSWDTEKLMGYSVAYPAVLSFLKETKIDAQISVKPVL